MPTSVSWCVNSTHPKPVFAMMSHSPGVFIYLEPALRQFEVFNIPYVFVKNADITALK